MYHSELSFESNISSGSSSAAHATAHSVTHAADDHVTPDSVESLADVDLYESKEQVAKALIEFLVTRFAKFGLSISLYAMTIIAPELARLRMFSAFFF